MHDEDAQAGSPASVSSPTPAGRAIAAAIEAAGGWLPFDDFMARALYAPGLGYYAGGAPVFGRMPEGGSDFVTAPELSPLFGRVLARQVAQALAASGTQEIVEFGAGSGALAAQLLQALDEAGCRVRRYIIVELAAALRQRQQARLAPWAGRVHWADAWPEAIEGVVVGNEVLDAMPVKLLHWDGTAWMERGVRRDGDSGFAWADRPTTLAPPHPGPYLPGTVTELHLQSQAWVRGLAQRLRRGLALLVDYGFPEAEYYHPQRHGGTLMAHRGHRADTDPLVDVGRKDLTAHLDFTALALAAQDAGLTVVGYTSQANFLLNCGLAEALAAADLRHRIDALKLVHEHEMGELFKVLALARDLDFEPIGFARGDRSHRL